MKTTKPLTEEVFVQTIRELRESLASQKGLEETQSDIKIVRVELQDIRGKTNTLEEKVNEISDRMMTGFDKVMTRLDDIDTNLTLNMHDTEELKEKIAIDKN